MSGLDHPMRYKQFFPQHMNPLHNQSELEFYDSMVAEIFGIKGIPVHYYPLKAEIEDADVVFGELPNKVFTRRHELTAVLKEEQIEETLLFNGFGQMNQTEFIIYFHISTYKGLVGQDRDPKPGDQFTFPYNSNLRFEITNVNFTTLGTDGNVFGRRTCYEIVAREAEVSYATEGISETYGLTQPYVIKEEDIGQELQIVRNNKVITIVPTECDVSSKVFILLPDIPCDAILPGGSIADKYIVIENQEEIANSHQGANDAIDEAAFGQNQPDWNDDLINNPIVKKERDYWDEW